MFLKKLYGYCALASVFGANLSALPAYGCGAFTVEELFDEHLAEKTAIAGKHKAYLQNGIVFGRAIPDAVTDMSLYHVGDDLGMIFGGGTMLGSMEFEIDPLPVTNFDAFKDAGVLSDFEGGAFVTGCDDTSKIPQYVGSGTIFTPDGETVPASIELVMWIVADGKNGDSNEFYAAGYVRSAILNGEFFVH